MAASSENVVNVMFIFYPHYSERKKYSVCITAIFYRLRGEGIFL